MPPTTPMIRLGSGRFAMGSERFYVDEGPVHEASVDAFELDVHPVTTEQFARFVEATGYVTTAERPLPESEFPELSVGERAAGALAFRPTAGPIPLTEWRLWWDWVPGANWREPFGPGGSVPFGAEVDRARHPVVQVSFEDASAYAEWAGKRLPTETEIEYAARAGLDSATYAWGEELHPGGELMANTWQGAFPWRNDGAAGWRGTSPVGEFAPNAWGFVDLIGNVWEWTTTPYTSRHEVDAYCGGGDAGAGGRPGEPLRRVLKGGSHLCAPEYCLRYRPAARSPQTDDTSTTHIGFRCARSV